MSVLLIAAFSCFGAGVLVDLSFGATFSRARPVPYGLSLAGSVLFAIAAARVFGGKGATFRLGSFFGVGTTIYRLDDLSALFLLLCFSLASAVSCCAWTWIRRESAPRRRGLASGYCICLASVAGILCAGDVFSFLFAWEMLTFSFYVLSGVNRAQRHGARGAWLTLASGKVSGAFLLIGMLLVAGADKSFSLAAFSGLARGDLHDIAYALLVAGFATKLGIVPLQAWMPVGYSAALGPTRAAMAGIAANVGAYGLWRTCALLGRPPVWLVVAVLLLGGITAVLGIAFAGVETRLSRVVAYSSVENAGIIFTGFGIALVGAATSDPTLEAAGLLAASLHVVAHAVAKSLLFSAVGNVEQALGTDELTRLRGIGKALPVSGAAFAAGAITLAGLPPSVGFVSEWFVLEALMQQFRLSGLALRLAMAGAGALIALTSGLAALAFLRVLGLTFLGPRNPDAHRSFDGGVLGRTGLVALGVTCFGLAAATPLEIRLLSDGLTPLVARHLVEQALKSPWVLQPTYAGFSILSPSWLFVAMPIAFISVLVLVGVGLSRGRYFKARRVPPWRSATSGVTGSSSYSAFGFANPLRHVLANVLGTRAESEQLQTFADNVRGRGRVEYTTRVVEPVESYLYRPVRAAFLKISGVAKRLQSGRLEAYVAYMLFALVVAIAVVAALN